MDITELAIYLDTWRDDLKECLLHDPKNLLKSKRPKLAQAITNDFPDPNIIMA